MCTISCCVDRGHISLTTNDRELIFETNCELCQLEKVIKVNYKPLPFIRVNCSSIHSDKGLKFETWYLKG